MRKLILIISILLCAGSAFSQLYHSPGFFSIDKFQVLDTAYLKCTYRLTHVRDTLKADKTKGIDMQILLIGKKKSKYFSQYMVDYCLYISNLFKKGDKNGRKPSGDQAIPNNPEKGTFGYEIYKNSSDTKMTVTDLKTRVGETQFGSNYQYEDEISDMKWDIKSDTSTVLSYSCQKATTTFRGRNYEAWFTTELPINNGPWKFGGLPGLILKISDNKQFHVFECIGIKKLKIMEPIKFYDLKYIKISRENLNKLYQRYEDDQVGYVISNGYTGKSYVSGPNDTMIEVKHFPKQPFNPIELK